MAKTSRSPAPSKGFYLRLTVEVCILVYAAVCYHRASQDKHAAAVKQASALDLESVANVNQLDTLLSRPKPGSNASSTATQSLRRELTALKSAATQLIALKKDSNKQPTACTSSLQETDAFYALGSAGTPCRAHEHAEYWGEPLVWGGDHRASSAAECCAACWAHRHAAERGGLDGKNSTVCNTWVYCGDKQRCGASFRECWLKVQKDLVALPATPPGRVAPDVMWTSGVIYPPAAEESAETSADSASSPGAILFQTPLGTIHVALKPDLAPGSVRELRRMVRLLALRGGRCGGCHLYRAEKNFLLQGVIREPGSYVATPRNPNPPQHKVMERGLVCWAGGAGGPDFFINVVDDSGFGDSHLCWGKITDMGLVDKIMELPLKPKARPNDMTFLKDFIYFNMTLVP